MEPHAAVATVIDFAKSAKLIGAGLAAMGMIGAGVGLGVLFGSYLQAAIRNPAGASSQQTMLFLGMALTETMGLFAFVVSLIILFGS
jgi:F-type H+-transporting ATPase subunit c|nr:F-type H+-transporting ATPase subunit c [Phenylobacterium sp.]